MFAALIFMIVLVAIAFSSLRIIAEYDRAVVFRFGRALERPKGPGIIFLIPLIDRIEAKVSTRTVTMDIDPQDVITLDNISLKVNAVLYFKVIDAQKAVLNVENFLYATSQLAQTRLRSALGEHTLDELLTCRDKINAELQVILDQSTDPWGIKVITVEVKHIDLPPDQQRAMARQAEAERERRAKVIAAEGELQASQTLLDAANLISKNPATLQLRYLQTLADMANDANSKLVVFPIPMEFLRALDTIGSMSNPGATKQSTEASRSDYQDPLG